MGIITRTAAMKTPISTLPRGSRAVLGNCHISTRPAMPLAPDEDNRIPQVDVGEESKAYLTCSIAEAVECGEFCAGDECSRNGPRNNGILLVEPNHIACKVSVDVANGIDQEAEEDNKPENQGLSCNAWANGRLDSRSVAFCQFCGFCFCRSIRKHTVVFGAALHEEAYTNCHYHQGNKTQRHVAEAPSACIDKHLGNGAEQHSAKTGEGGAKADYQACARAEPTCS